MPWRKSIAIKENDIFLKRHILDLDNTEKPILNYGNQQQKIWYGGVRTKKRNKKDWRLGKPVRGI